MKNPPVTLILRGPPGVGKTSIALLLRDRLAPAVRISIDTLRYLVHPRVLSEEHLRVAKMNAAHMAIGYRSIGISSVIESVFQSESTLAATCYVLDQAGIDYRIITLRASLSTLLKRNQGRPEFYRTQGRRIEDLARNYNWSVGHTIQCDDKIIEEVVSEILEYLDVASMTSTQVLASKSRYCLFVRHGHCHLDESFYQRQNDVHLSEAGRTQLEQLVPAIAAFKPDVAFVSPLARTRESASILSHQLPLPVNVDERLAERVFASLQGLSFVDVANMHSSEVAQILLTRSESLELPGEERFEDAQHRVVECIRELISGTYRRALVVSHGGPHSWLCGHYLKTPKEQLRSYALDHGHFSVFEYDDFGSFRKVRAMNVAYADAGWWSN